MTIYRDPEAAAIAAALREGKTLKDHLRVAPLDGVDLTREPNAEDRILAALESIGRRIGAMADLCATTIDAQNRIERRLSAIEAHIFAPFTWCDSLDGRAGHGTGIRVSFQDEHEPT